MTVKGMGAKKNHTLVREPPAGGNILRLVDRFEWLKDYPACRSHVVRATARTTFVKVHAGRRYFLLQQIERKK
jgi:hypothetical protein